MAESKRVQLHEIGDLCDGLVEHLEDGEQAEAIATAEQILQQVRQYSGTIS